MNKITKSIIITTSMIGFAYADNNLPHHSSLNRWTGFYAGINAGGIFNHIQLRSEQFGFTNPSENYNDNSDYSIFAPGIQLGYLYQFSNYLVSGFETNITFNTNQNNILKYSSPNNSNVFDSFSFRNKMQISFKGRGGRAFNWDKTIILPYLTAGASIANAGLTYTNEGGDFYSKNTTAFGWLIGTGIEWSFRKNWSVRAEYNYADYGNTLTLKIPSIYGLEDPNGNAQVALHASNFLIAINYWI